MFVADIATAALAINNMAAHPSARLALVKAGVVKVLVASLERVSGELDNDARESARKAGVSSAPEESCVRALWSLAPEPAAAAQIASEGAVAMLLGLLSQSANTKIRHGVAAACNGALRVLTGSDANRQVLSLRLSRAPC